MLEDHPVQNLHYDSNLRIAQAPRVEPTIFSGPTSITSQPRTLPNDINGDLGTDSPAIVSSGQYRGGTANFLRNTFTSGSGLNLLYNLPSIHIEQTFELNESLYSLSSENRYIIRSPSNEAVFAATESSTERSRLIWGSRRPFSMHLMDKAHQEVVTLIRRFACGTLFCNPHCMEVWIPPGVLLGRVIQNRSIFECNFEVQDADRTVLYNIEGPAGIQSCSGPKQAHYRILSADYINQEGTLTRLWNTDVSKNTTNIYFSDNELDVKRKTLLIGAAFLFEYLFYQSKSRFCCCGQSN